MGDSTRDDVYRRAITRWGMEAQLRMLAEECSELSAEVNRFLRHRHGLHELAEEIADVAIMVEQAALIVGPEILEAAKARKLERLRGRIEQRGVEVQRG